LIKLIIY